MPLTDAEIRRTPLTERAQKLFDGGDLYLFIRPNGSRWRRLKFRTAGKEQLLSLGVYPEVTLKATGEHRESLRKQLHADVAPSVQRRVQKHTRAVAAARSVEVRCARSMATAATSLPSTRCSSSRSSSRVQGSYAPRNTWPRCSSSWAPTMNWPSA